MAVLIFALADLLEVVLGSALESALGSVLGSALGSALRSALVAAVVAAVVAASVFASMTASMAMLLTFLLLLAKSLSSRVGDALLSSPVDFVRKVATIQASSRDRYLAEVPTYSALLLEGRYFLEGLRASREMKWRQIKLRRDMCLNCSVRMAPSIS